MVDGGSHGEFPEIERSINPGERNGEGEIAYGTYIAAEHGLFAHYEPVKTKETGAAEKMNVVRSRGPT